MNSKHFLCSAIAASSLMIGALSTAQAASSDLQATDAWSRPTANAALAGVVYLKVTDSGAPTTLVAVSTPVADHAEMHHSTMQNGMMMMLPVTSMPISPRAPISFSPDAYHIMLTGLHQTLSVGQTFPITLRFADGETVTTTVTVRPMEAGAAPAGGDSMGGMKM